MKNADNIKLLRTYAIKYNMLPEMQASQSLADLIPLTSR